MADPADIGFAIGQKVAGLIKDRPTEKPVVNVTPNVEPPIVHVPVSVETDAIAKAIDDAKFDPSGIVSSLTGILEAISSASLEALQISIERIDNRREIDKLTEAINKQTEMLQAHTAAISDGHAANINTLADAILRVGKTQADGISALLAVVQQQGAQIVEIQAMQSELVAIGMADRMIVENANGDPVGIRIERRVN